MDMNRNAIWRNPSAVPQDGIDRMNSFWGDESWREAAYAQHPQGNLFGAPDIVKQGNDAIVGAWRESGHPFLCVRKADLVSHDDTC